MENNGSIIRYHRFFAIMINSTLEIGYYKLKDILST